MCYIQGIPLKRTNAPGKNSEWYNNLNSVNQHEVSTHLDDLNPIGWNNCKKSSNKIYAPINDLRAQVIEEQKIYKHNLHQYENRSNSHNGSLINPIQIKEEDDVSSKVDINKRTSFSSMSNNKVLVNQTLIPIVTVGPNTETVTTSKYPEIFHFNVEKVSSSTISINDTVSLTEYINHKCTDKFPKDLTIPPRETDYFTISIPNDDDPSFLAVKNKFMYGQSFGLFYELTRISGNPIPGARPMFREGNLMIYQKNMKQQMTNLKLLSPVNDMPTWTNSLPSHHPNSRVLNSLSKQVINQIREELRKNKKSTIPLLPDYCYWGYLSQYIDLVYQEHFCWNIGLVTNLIAKSKLKSNSYPSTKMCPVPQECFRCVFPNSVIFKQWHHDTGIGGFLSHCGIPHFNCGIFD